MEEEEDGFGCIGSMFDSCHTRSIKKVKLNHGVNFDLKFIDMEPGHVISGQYLWPAAEALGNFLVDQWDKYRADNILELGAGCGLAGIAVAALEGTKTVVFTDNDPGALGLISDNLAMNALDHKGSVHSLAWGAAVPTEIKDAFTAPESLLLIGSDLIYCKGVVRPLLTTARALFDLVGTERSVGFVLCFSFDTGEDVEEELKSSCHDLMLSCSELSKLNLQAKQCRFLVFRPMVASSSSSHHREEDAMRGSEEEEEGGQGEAVSAEEQRMRNDKKRSEFISNFALTRDWSLISSMWTALVRSAALPPIIRGYKEDCVYGVTDLDVIHDIGREEFKSEDTRYKRKTFAVRLGYVGTAYKGYQEQRLPGGQVIETVERDIRLALNIGSCAAGRTDAEVSALSQIVSFHSFDDLTPEKVVGMFEAGEGCIQGKLRVFQCVQVPKSFHALFSATWRRYIYAFPLCSKRANMSQAEDSTTAPETRWFPATVHSLEGRADGEAFVDVDCAFINDALSRLIGRSLHYNAYAAGEHLHGGEPDPKDLCTLYKADCRVVDITGFHNNHIAPSQLASESENNNSRLVLFIELVGNRFLRKMVRRLTATVIRESIKSSECRDVEALVKIGISKNRAAAELPLPGQGLCMCGVGYDPSTIKAFVPKRPKNKNKTESSEPVVNR